jgi:hypothetical protein
MLLTPLVATGLVLLQARFMGKKIYRRRMLVALPLMMLLIAELSFLRD